MFDISAIAHNKRCRLTPSPPTPPHTHIHLFLSFLQFDPAATYTIPSNKLVKLFMELKPPLGFGGRATKQQAHTYVVSLELPDYDGFVPFKDVCTHTAIALHAEKVSQTGSKGAEEQARAARENMFACEVEGGKSMLDEATKKRLAELNGRAHLGSRGSKKPTSTWAEYAAAVKFQQAFRRNIARRKAREMLRDQGHYVEDWEQKRRSAGGAVARTRKASLAAGNAVSALFGAINGGVETYDVGDELAPAAIMATTSSPSRAALGRSRSMNRNSTWVSPEPRAGLSLSGNRLSRTVGASGRASVALGANSRGSPAKAPKTVHHLERKAVEQAVRRAEDQAKAEGVDDTQRRRMVEVARAKAVRKARRKREEQRFQRVGTSASAAQLSRISVSQNRRRSMQLSPLKQRRLARHQELQRKHGAFMRQQNKLLATAPAQVRTPAAAPVAASSPADAMIAGTATAPAAARAGRWDQASGAGSARASPGRGRGRGRRVGRGRGSSAPPQPAPATEAGHAEDRKVALLRAQSEADRAKAALLEAETKQLQLRAQLAALKQKDAIV